MRHTKRNLKLSTARFLEWMTARERVTERAIGDIPGLVPAMRSASIVDSIIDSATGKWKVLSGQEYLVTLRRYLRNDITSQERAYLWRRLMGDPAYLPLLRPYAR
jgi:hypothetical protein